MSYAANKVIAAALLDTSRGNSFTPCDIELVSDALCNLSNESLRRIASIIAVGLKNSDDSDSVDQLEVGRIVTGAVYSQAKSMLAEEIAREEADEAAETQADIDADLLAMDNAERVRDMRRVA